MEEKISNSEKAAFIGVIGLFAVSISIWFIHLNQENEYEDTEPTKSYSDFRPIVPYDSERKEKDTVFIYIDNRPTHRLNRFRRIEPDLDRYIEDYIEDNPDLIQEYLDR